jgi:hypothetical protein
MQASGSEGSPWYSIGFLLLQAQYMNGGFGLRKDGTLKMKMSAKPLRIVQDQGGRQARQSPSNISQAVFSRQIGCKRRIGSRRANSNAVRATGRLAKSLQVLAKAFCVKRSCFKRKGQRANIANLRRQAGSRILSKFQEFILCGANVLQEKRFRTKSEYFKAKENRRLAKSFQFLVSMFCAK